MRAGRLLSATDRLETPPVAMVNQAFAARYLAGVDPIGQRLTIGSPDRERPMTTIVGVVADYRNNGTTPTCASGDLRSGAAADRLEPALHADSNRQCAGSAPAICASGRDVARSRTARLHDSDARGRARRFVVPAADLDAPARHLCRGCSRARGYRYLRRHVLRGDRPYAGDGCPPRRSAPSDAT